MPFANVPFLASNSSSVILRISIPIMMPITVLTMPMISHVTILSTILRMPVLTSPCIKHGTPHELKRMHITPNNTL